MSTEHDPIRQHREQAEPAKHQSEPAEETRTPEAVEAVQVARDGERKGPDRQRRAWGVEWVRPTDLIARQTGTVAGRGIDFQAELARRVRARLGSNTRSLGERARRLPPLSAFGRSRLTPSGPVRSRVGMS
ncbi:hypothetical protein [Microlunatus parietis]|uniref:Uncharacterized protein n=1 Tax=Microlunatus parietis TaxID=682979 RepID=A0A7Y9I8A5_9ACTN|nr:hypothetical protein [Microlunatus parietis]NYE72110.1 hypothetical protein [Microlunatus parietis]